jgi:hypothetical protein
MPENPRSKLFITCQEATYLMSKDEARAAGLMDKIRLAIHLMICEFCRRFRKQTAIIVREAGNLAPEARLSEEEKVAMEKAVNAKENGVP